MIRILSNRNISGHGVPAFAFKKAVLEDSGDQKISSKPVCKVTSLLFTAKKYLTWRKR